jgi:hypothetical protein
MTAGGFGDVEKVAKLRRCQNGGALDVGHARSLKVVEIASVQREEPAGSFSSIPQAKPTNLGK